MTSSHIYFWECISSMWWFHLTSLREMQLTMQKCTFDSELALLLWFFLLLCVIAFFYSTMFISFDRWVRYFFQQRVQFILSSLLRSFLLATHGPFYILYVRCKSSYQGCLLYCLNSILSCSHLIMNRKKYMQIMHACKEYLNNLYSYLNPTLYICFG
jgi:hypothetical protein